MWRELSTRTAENLHWRLLRDAQSIDGWLASWPGRAQALTRFWTTSLQRSGRMNHLSRVRESHSIASRRLSHSNVMAGLLEYTRAFAIDRGERARRRTTGIVELAV
jgi:hypothetical protein